MITTRGLYIHIPFCIKKCAYCDFFSVAMDTDIANKYIDEVCRELSLLTAEYPDTLIDTVYIGGGTPSVLPESILARLVEHIYKCANVNIKEFTIEVNPCSSDKLIFYKTLGINRVSIGVQTLHPSILKIIGRSHNSDQAMDALSRASDTFDNVSADIMLGLPMQTVFDVEDTLLRILPYVTHISQYMLKLSDGVPLAQSAAKKQIVLPDDDSMADMYEAGYSLMQNNAFERYEISNFAINNCNCMHNLKYWNREEYMGIGAAAHSFIDGVRYDNPASLTDYFNGKHLGNKCANVTELTNSDALFEYIMLKLRLENGFSINDINSKFHINFTKQYKTQLNTIADLLDTTNGIVRMKPDKMLLESYAARVFL